MKQLIIALTLVCASISVQSQTIPDVKVKNMEGTTVSTNSIINDGKPMIVSFWATWCKPCIKELETIHEVYSDWQKETGVKLVIVSIDDARTTASVAPFLNAKGWEYESYLDPNSDFKRAMNVNMVPHTFLLNGNREVINQHTSFAPGDEDKLFEKVKAAAAGK
ncbi:MAG: TlpA family protein disulfide reductase [Bacteroidota bacterium]|jgi:thiol-disulfide isomerase/thioredoxin